MIITNLQTELKRSKGDVDRAKKELKKLKSSIIEKEKSHETLRSSIEALQVQIGDLKRLEVSFSHGHEDFIQATAKTELQAKDSRHSNAALQDQLAATEQRMSEQIQVLTVLHEQNLTAVKDLATTQSELEQHQNLLNYATSTVTNLELLNVALQSRIDQEGTMADNGAREAWKAPIGDPAYTGPEASCPPRVAASLVHRGTTAVGSSDACD